MTGREMPGGDRWFVAAVGDELGPDEFSLTRELQERFTGGSRNELPVHREIVDPSIAGNLAIRLLGSRYPGSIIHSHQDLAFHTTVRVGETLVGTGRIVLKEMRRAKAYVACECEFRRPGGELAWSGRLVCVWPEVHLRAGA